LTDVIAEQDETIVQVWRSGLLTVREVAERCACSLYRVQSALERCRVPPWERRERTLALRRQYHNGQGQLARARAEQAVDQMLGPGVSIRAMATAAQVAAPMISEVLIARGIDPQSLRAQGQKTGPRQRRPSHGHQCLRCEILISRAAVSGLGRVRRFYDDMCFVCWFEVLTGRWLPLDNTISVQELRRMAMQYHSAAIPTAWKGTLYDTRRDARWAVFLTRAEIDWEYKIMPHGERAFWLPDLDTWIVTRGAEPGQEEAQRLAAQGSVCVFVGPPVAFPDVDNGDAPGYRVSLDDLPMPVTFKQCVECECYAIVPRVREVCPECGAEALEEEPGTLLHARRAARRAKFAHDRCLAGG